MHVAATCHRSTPDAAAKKTCNKPHAQLTHRPTPTPPNLRSPLKLALLFLQRLDLLQHLRVLNVRFHPLGQWQSGGARTLRVLLFERARVVLEQLLDRGADLGIDAASVETDDVFLDAALGEEAAIRKAFCRTTIDTSRKSNAGLLHSIS